MLNYQTIGEKAAEWNVTPRHVQYLCRAGKIQGAIKRAGSWFIPGDTPIPAKNTKSDAKAFMFVGTKNRIFCEAIRLFMSKGFNNVSLRDIAASVGIRQSTIYNHFKSKQELLDTVYDYYCYYYLKDRPSLTDMESILQSENLMEIFRLIRYEFQDDYRQKMSDITKIIFQRIAIDDRAKDIAQSLMVDEGIQYVENVFDMAIASGRFAPFDTHSMAVFFNSLRIFTLYVWVIDRSPEHMKKMLEDEQALYKYAAEFINDLKPLDNHGKRWP